MSSLISCGRTRARAIRTARRVIHIGLGLALFATLSGPVLSHHSNAMFNKDETMVLTGVVTKFDYVNPHAWLYVDVANEDGSVTAWGFETSAPPRLRRLGMSPNYWKPGDLVTIKTHPLKDGRPAGSLEGSIKADGTTYRDVEGLGAPQS